jgi:dGTPase
MIYTKEDLEKLEKKHLAPYAVLSKNSKGRVHEEKGSNRLCFQKDRDRIIHCKSFRRLDEKTQVFPAFVGDHYRTRLTHTLEVAQISRDICRRLGLNEDLAEAIALAHDLGHPPFGHAGEEALDEVLREAGEKGFEHNMQSKRVVEKLEKLYPNFDGLNLSIEVLEGLAKHQTSWDQDGVDLGGNMHFEGQVVNLADEIAYTNHDMDDGLRSGILDVEDLKGTSLWKKSCRLILEEYGEIPCDDVWKSRVISKIIFLMIDDIVKTFDETCVCFSEEMVDEIRELREILFEKFYLSLQVKDQLDKGRDMIKSLFKFYLRCPDKIPSKYLGAGVAGGSVGIIAEGLKDYIAGMTDRFLQKQVEKYANMGEL